MFTCGLDRSNFSFAISVAPRILELNPGLARDLGDDFLADVARRLFVLLEVHRVRRASLSAGAQVGRVPEHGRERDHRGDDLRAAAGDLSLQLAAPPREVAG